METFHLHGATNRNLLIVNNTVTTFRGSDVIPGSSNPDHIKEMTEADAIVLGSSTYSTDVSSTLKAVIERASVVSVTNPGSRFGSNPLK